MSVVCGNRKGHAEFSPVKHASVDSVRACYKGVNVGPCTWLVRKGYDEDGWEVIQDCGELAFFTDFGWSCEAGHNHVSLDVRHAEGWDYASDQGEVEAAAKEGFDFRI